MIEYQPLAHVKRKNIRKRAGVVERAALEMRYTRKGIEGSNPSASAKQKIRSDKSRADFLIRIIV